MAKLTRRDFAKTMAASALGAYVSPGAGADSWFDEPLRWGQLTLLERAWRSRVRWAFCARSWGNRCGEAEV